MERSSSHLYVDGMDGLDGMGLFIIGRLGNLSAPSMQIIAAIL